jgi:hypothetical protein
MCRYDEGQKERSGRGAEAWGHNRQAWWGFKELGGGEWGMRWWRRAPSQPWRGGGGGAKQRHPAGHGGCCTDWIRRGNYVLYLSCK